MDLPPSLARLDGQVGGVTDTGELIIKQSRRGGPADTLSVLNPQTGAVEAVVSRAPKTLDEASSQIGTATGNADWVIWDEGSNTTAAGEWTMWSIDRHTGKVRKVAMFEAGSNGRAVPGSPSAVSMLGDFAAWSADVEVPGGNAEPRIYLADLRAGTTRRLDPHARWPSLVSKDRVAAAVTIGRDADGKTIAQPSTITIGDGSVAGADWTQPGRVLAHAGSESGTVVVRLVKASTAAVPDTVAEIVTHENGGTRTFSLPNGLGGVAAGRGFLAWLDERHFWILPSGDRDPHLMVDVLDDTIGVGMIATGSTIYWWTDTASGRSTEMLATVSC